MDKTYLGTPPTKCDICDRPTPNTFVDGKTKTGPWANMCSRCHMFHGEGLGTGKGQRYERQNDGTWKKMQG